jgi:hypothetical protein
MLKATSMMKFLKSRNLEVIQMSKVVWRKQTLASDQPACWAFVLIRYIPFFHFFFGEGHNKSSWIVL